jgi:hypothetical protein
LLIVYFDVLFTYFGYVTCNMKQVLCVICIVLQKDFILLSVSILSLTSNLDMCLQIVYLNFAFYNKFMKFSFKILVGDLVRNWHVRSQLRVISMLHIHIMIHVI